jgi:hypothetical protein
MLVTRVVSNARTHAAHWCVGSNNKYWLVTLGFDVASKQYRRQGTSRVVSGTLGTEWVGSVSFYQ